MQMLFHPAQRWLSFPLPRGLPLGIFLVLVGLFSGCWKTTVVDGFPSEYSGVGLELVISDGRIKVVKPLVGGPAEAAGILAGDYLIAIDNRPTEPENFGQIVSQLRGDRNTQVNITLEREGKQFHAILSRKRTKKVGEQYVFEE